jgi:hypothetical protein
LIISSSEYNLWLTGLEELVEVQATRAHHDLWRPNLFVWLVADGWCWFVLREKYYWLVADG